MIYICVFSWIEKLFLHQLHILDFQMLSTETRNQRKRNGNVVRTYVLIRPVYSRLCNGLRDDVLQFYKVFSLFLQQRRYQNNHVSECHLLSSRNFHVYWSELKGS